MASIESICMLLRVAKEVSAEIPVPGLSTALALALSIVESAQEIKDIRDDRRSLAERAARFSLGVYEQLKQCNVDNQSIATKERVMLLLCTLCDIESFMKRRRKMRLRSLLRRQPDIAEVQKHRTQLEDAIKLFTIQTGISIEQTMDMIVNTNGRILQHIEDSARVGDALVGETRFIRNGIVDLAQQLSGSSRYSGGLRLFARENLDLLEPLPTGKSESTQCDRAVTQVNTGCVIRYRAAVNAAGELSGAQVVVHVYSNNDDPQFAESVKFAQRMWNPYVVAVLGHSRLEDPGADSFIVTEDYTPFMAHLHSFQGVDQLRQFMEATESMSRGVTPLYVFAPGEIVFDHRRGGRFKWAWGPRLEQVCYGELQVTAILTRERRSSQFDNYCQFKLNRCAESPAALWLHQLLTFWMWGGPLRKRYKLWQVAHNHPWYALGAWLGRDRNVGRWAVLASQCAWPGAAAENDVGVSRLSNHAHEELLVPEEPKQVFTGYMINAPAQADMNVGTSRARWMRYQFPCAPVGRTLVFRQSLGLRMSLKALVRTAAALSVPPWTVEQRAGLPTEHVYNTYVTVSTASQAMEQESAPLWFFLFNRSVRDSDHSYYTHSQNVPHGFWSVEENPGSIPANIAFDPTSRSQDYVRPDSDNFQTYDSGGDGKPPLSQWTQMLGNLTFTVRTEMYIGVTELTEGDLLAIEALQEYDEYAAAAHHADAYAIPGTGYQCSSEQFGTCAFSAATDAWSYVDAENETS